MPVLAVLDDFDDNLSARPARPAIEDPALAGLLASWASAPGLARLLITCRDPVMLPATAGPVLGLRCVGPLSPSGAARLAASLPVLSLLDEPEVGQAWRLTGGHPRTMEYLNALLIGGQADFGEVAGRLAAAIQARTGQAVLRRDPGGSGPPAPGAAQKVAQVAGDVLLGELCARLSPDARDLLTGASVYREPVGSHVLLLPAGQPRRAAGLTGLVAECVAAGLLTADYSGELPSVFVHRWTASELHRRLAAERRGEEVADAHRRAAEYWRWRISSWPHDRHALHEASYHLLQAGDQGRRGNAGARRGAKRRMIMIAAAALAVVVAAGVTGAAAGAFSALARAPGQSAHGGSPASATGPGTPAARSAAVRGQAAAWVARQVGQDAIVACDPAMCAALQAHGITPGNLLVLRPSSADPLGSDLVMATPAVRSQFGSRLASVYAPVVIASFGSGGLRIDVRTVAPDGAAAYRAGLAADLGARRDAGRQLLQNPRISVSATARADLAAGRVDARLLLTLAAVASVEPVRVAAFSDSGPGAAAGVPLRAAALSGPAQPGPGSANGPDLRARAAPAVPAGAGPDRPRARRHTAAQRAVRRAQPGRPAPVRATARPRPRLTPYGRPRRPAVTRAGPSQGPGPRTRNPLTEGHHSHDTARTGDRVPHRPPRGSRGPMRLPRKVIRAAAVAAVMAYAVLLGAVPAGAAAPGGWVRLAHLSPNAPAVDVYLYSFGNPQARLVLHHVSYGMVSPYQEVSAGDYTVSMRAAGAAASAQPLLSTGFRVSLGQAYTVAGMGPAAGLRLQVLKDTLTVPSGRALIRVIQASLREHVVSVRLSGLTLARKLDFASTTPYQAVPAGSTVARVAGDTEGASLGMSLRPDTIHTLVVLDGPGHLRLTDLEDAAGSAIRPAGGTATGLGGTAPRPASSPVPWLAVLGTGILVAGGAARRCRRIRTP